MLLIRKIDCLGQVILTGIMIASVFFLLTGGGFLLGLFYLGCWQLLSAILNTYSFAHCGFTNRIFLYWMLCLIDLTLLFFSYWLEFLRGDVIGETIFMISLIGGFAIAVYYWWIYHKLIGFIFLRNELDGLTKSRH